MTDLLDFAPLVDLPEGWKQCKECGEPFNPPHQASKYCDLHSTPEAARRRKKAQRTGPNGDRAPHSVGDIHLNLNTPGPAKGSKKDAEIARVRERAKQLAGIIAMLVDISGHEADAIDINNGADAWAGAVAQLAQYEDWLRRIAAGGEAGDRAMAWITLAMATIGMVLPILVRHEVLPAHLAAMAQTMTGAPDGAT